MSQCWGFRRGPLQQNTSSRSFAYVCMCSTQILFLPYGALRMKRPWQARAKSGGIAAVLDSEEECLTATTAGVQWGIFPAISSSESKSAKYSSELRAAMLCCCRRLKRALRGPCPQAVTTGVSTFVTSQEWRPSSRLILLDRCLMPGALVSPRYSVSYIEAMRSVFSESQSLSLSVSVSDSA